MGTTILMPRRHALAEPAAAARYSLMANICYERLEKMIIQNSRVYPLVVAVAEIAQRQLDAYCDLMEKAGRPVSDSRKSELEEMVWGSGPEHTSADVRIYRSRMQKRNSVISYQNQYRY